MLSTLDEAFISNNWYPFAISFRVLANTSSIYLGYQSCNIGIHLHVSLPWIDLSIDIYIYIFHVLSLCLFNYINQKLRKRKAKKAYYNFICFTSCCCSPLSSSKEF